MPKPTIPATADKLRQILDRRPVLWVGAGLSIAGGLPSTKALCDAIIADADVTLDPALPFEQLADAFVAAMGTGALGDLLQREIGGSHPLTELHQAIARSAAERKFAAIVTTNYDDLLERALAEAEVRFVHQVLEDNAVVVDPKAELRLLKLHGSRDDWQRVILSGSSYAAFGKSYPFLEKQLHVLLRQHPVLFVGCSLLDPRIADWLDGLEDPAVKGLKPWRAAMTVATWDTAKTERPSLLRAPLQPLTLDDHSHLPRLWSEIEPRKTPTGEMSIDIVVGASRLDASFDGGAPWTMANPLDDVDLLSAIEVLADLGMRPVPSDRQGKVTSAAARQTMAELRKHAVAVGDALTALLSDPARERLTKLEAAARTGSAALLRLRVAIGANGEEALADRLLALPWELLRVAGRFPVSTHTIDLVREAVVAGLPGLDEPTDELKVVATVAAPFDQPSVDYENEIYRLWQALGAAHEGRLQVTDLGTLDDLAAQVAKFSPPVVHFTGHGEPGALLFEDEAAASRPVPVIELINKLHAKDGPLPRLIYLSTCHGASVRAATQVPLAAVRAADRMVDLATVAALPSTAAELHRGGFAQVLGYFGPVGDTQATRIAAKFYGGLAAGKTARAALREAREEAATALPLADGFGVYPLGWAQMALYHRGLDRPTTLPAKKAAGSLAPPERFFDRMDRKGGTVRIERRHDEPVVGVQQLREGMGFVGRRKPRSTAIGRWRKNQRLLVVQGLGGLGKTALCAELLRLLAKGKIVAFDGRWAGSQPNPVLALWHELQAARDDELWSNRLAAIQKDSVLSADTLLRAITALGELESGLTLYLDDAESLMEPPGPGAILGKWRDEQLNSFWQGLVNLVKQGTVGVLVSTRYRPRDTPDGAVLPLDPMSRWEILKVIAWLPTLHRLPHSDRDWLTERIAGHPRSLEWLEVLVAQKERQLAPPGGQFQGDWRGRVLAPIFGRLGKEIEADLFLKLIWQMLDKTAREHLGRACVLEAPAPWEVILAIAPDEGDDSARRLVDGGLLSPFQGPEGDSWWKPHGLVTGAISPLWNGTTADAHCCVAVAFRALAAGRPGSFYVSRAIEHFCAGGDGNSAWALAEPLAIALRADGRFREALSWVERILHTGLDKSGRGMATKHRVQLLRMAGRLVQEGEALLLGALDLVQENERGHVLYELGCFSHARGRLMDAEAYFGRAIAWAREENGELDGESARYLDGMAGVLFGQDKLSEARCLYEESFALRQRLGLASSREAAVTLNSLASVLQKQGRLGEAQQRLDQVFEIRSRIFSSENHPEMAASYHARGVLRTAIGNLADAKKDFERSIAIKMLVFGSEEHPDIAASFHELAGVLNTLGESRHAKETIEKAIEIYSKAYGDDDHIDIAAARHVLALILGDLEYRDESQEIFERALKSYIKAYGSEEHASIAAVMHGLAQVLKARGDLAGARRYLLRSIEIKKKTYISEENSEITASLHELASIYQAEKDLLGARELLERVLRLEIKIYSSEEHYATAITEEILGFVLMDLGEKDAGLRFLKHAFEVYSRQLGSEHKYTLQLKKSLARMPGPGDSSADADDLRNN